MTTRRVLQLCVWLAGLRLSRPDDPAPGPAPHAQVGVLTEGLLRLLSGVEESERLVERQGRQAAQELRRHARELSRMRRRTQRVDRMWAGLRREMQVGAAREEGLSRGAESLRELIGWDGLENRMTRVQELVQADTGARGAKAMALNFTALQVSKVMVNWAGEKEVE